VTGGGLTLIGDGIENPHNALALVDVATALGATCAFLDRKRLQQDMQAIYPDAGPLPGITLDMLAAAYQPIIACETLPDAVDVFGLRPVRGGRPAVVVGNERRGVEHATLALARQRIRIPMSPRGIGSLNVAAAAAMALYYLGSGSGPMSVRRHPAAHRPDLLLVGAGDHVELGCAVPMPVMCELSRSYIVLDKTSESPFMVIGWRKALHLRRCPSCRYAGRR
jgi:hypothetical protein